MWTAAEENSSLLNYNDLKRNMSAALTSCCFEYKYSLAVNSSNHFFFRKCDFFWNKPQNMWPLSWLRVALVHKLFHNSLLLFFFINIWNTAAFGQKSGLFQHNNDSSRPHVNQWTSRQFTGTSIQRQRHKVLKYTHTHIYINIMFLLCNWYV